MYFNKKNVKKADTINSHGAEAGNRKCLEEVCMTQACPAGDKSGLRDNSERQYAYFASGYNVIIGYWPCGVLVTGLTSRKPRPLCEPETCTAPSQ